jgi:hypothetical protein
MAPQLRRSRLTDNGTGTGVDVLGPKSNASGQFNVSVDGALIGTFSEFAKTYTPQSVIYSARHLAPGTHTIQLVKESSSYFQIDAFRVVPNSVELNDTSTSIAYTGAHSTATLLGDPQPNTRHAYSHPHEDRRRPSTTRRCDYLALMATTGQCHISEHEVIMATSAENKVRLYEVALGDGRSASPFVWRIPVIFTGKMQ